MQKIQHLANIQNETIILSPQIYTKFQKLSAQLGKEKVYTIVSETIIEMLEDMEDAITIEERKHEKKDAISFSQLKKELSYV